MLYVVCFFFFKQKTAYEMRISDWSSDVCSSDLTGPDQRPCHWQGAPDRAWHRHSPERRPRWPSALPLRCGPDREREWIESYPGSRKRLAHHLRSEEHTSELQSLMRISYAVFCLKKKTSQTINLEHKSKRNERRST